MWIEENNKLVKHFSFKDFISAFSFLSKVALISEKLDHHPEIINVYNKVTIKLSTHDIGNKVSKKDYDLAKAIDELL
ncbi:MAG TPA: pterin-4-alpha-carbinolamine dehydratase [Cytophagales bacterium]|jgi:4a-hydroxytetrahydrobiopterin dehydratase|uniref:4a-hydroxytetrahydrobiopterin dehydratase n=1 Tax=marine metagenome TaxID=408172 RepID=A0A381NVH9_9ZZZZ|nr:4a-hydroxytetrahydrobiopterin dehydratase [Bacteroidota bacterium]MEE3112618.1 4a-hydroxytetrahydrobiopterin dehydratase [Bacteroidota bacterium]HIF48830.1 pterin-4-alpha-carbinolamine dehydratase [Cytophagales bacterium]|tara:strand:- start:341 stop:571 length:231 start_codon:yes stop_codon:yes gene_type:complete